jgi:phosphoglycerate dehydrogenase-like enzyme
MDVILHHAAYERVRHRVEDLSGNVRFLCLEADGSITLEGERIESGDCAPEGFWLSMDMIGDGLIPQSFDLICAGSVKWLQTFNAGLDNPRYRDVIGAGVRITNSSAQAVAISEYVLAQVLAVSHPIDEQRAAQDAHEWKRTPFKEISRSTWLIVGYGHIGKETAKRVAAFGARIMVVRRRDAADELVSLTARPDALPELLPEADVIVLACPLTAETRGMADAAFFAAVKQDAILVNIARGGLIDDQALLDCLNSGRLKAAVLDVFEPEPLPADSTYWDHPRVRVTGHTSFNGDGTAARGDDLFVRNVHNYVAGDVLENEVDPTDLPRFGDG